MISKVLLVTAALGALSLGGAANAATNLIRNGNFDNAVGSSWAAVANDANWTNANEGTYEVGKSSVYGLACFTTKCQNLEVNGNLLGSVSQTFTVTDTTKAYNLTWAYGGRDGGGLQGVNVILNGKTIATDYSNGTKADAVWTVSTFVVKSPSATETLTFQAIDRGGSPTYGDEITGLSFSAVPEPATWALMMIGFGGLGAALRSRRKLVPLAA